MASRPQNPISRSSSRLRNGFPFSRPDKPTLLSRHSDLLPCRSSGICCFFSSFPFFDSLRRPVSLYTKWPRCVSFCGQRSCLGVRLEPSIGRYPVGDVLKKRDLELSLIQNTIYKHARCEKYCQSLGNRIAVKEVRLLAEAVLFGTKESENMNN